MADPKNPLDWAGPGDHNRRLFSSETHEMRADMPKVIVERARTGGGKLRKGRSLRDPDLALSKIGLKRDAELRGGDKSLNENLNPLRRFLERQVGRPWRKVWSEICENLKPSNTVQQHVRDHIPDFVAIKTTLRGKEVWVNDRFGPRPLKDAYARLYVDPKTGILRRNKHRKSWLSLARAQRKAEDDARHARMRAVGALRQLHRFGDGTWWDVELAPVPTIEEVVKDRFGQRRVSRETPAIDAVLRAGLSKLPRQELYGRAGVYAVAKRQLSSKEMRALSLR